MIHKINKFVHQYEQKIHIAYILLFITIISFSFFFRKGIEFLRYGLVAFTAIIIFTNTDYCKKIKIDKAFLTLLLFITISTISLVYNNASIGKIDDAVNWALCYIFGFMVFNILKQNAIIVLFSIPIFLFLFQITYPFFTGTLIDNLNFLSGKRLDLFFDGKPIHLGIFAGISTFTGLYIFIRSIHNYTKIAAFVLILTSFLVLLSTGTRTSFIGTVITISIFSVYFFSTKIRLSHLAIASLSIISITSILIFYKNEARISSLANSEEVIDSFEERKLIFILAKDSFLRSPIVGEGFDMFSEIYQNNIATYADDENAKEEYAYILASTNNAHNFSLHFLTETGILGFLCMNAFWILIIRNGLKSRSDITKIISGIYLLSYIAFQFNMSLYGNQMSTLLFSLAGLSGAAFQDSKHSDPLSDDKINHPLLQLKAFR